MKKEILVLVTVSILTTVAISGYAITGFFSKAFDKTLSPGEIYEKNITVRKYYNLTVRFQKEDSTSYLSFDNNETRIVVKDSSGNEIASGTGVINAKMYFFLSREAIDSISTVSASNLGTYEDVVSQPVNATFSGTTAYITVKLRAKSPQVQGFVLDELTKQPVEAVTVLAVKDSEDPQITLPQAEAVTDSNGFYRMSFNISTSTALDFYVKNYEVV